MATVPVSLSPRPGFCVKSTTLGPGVIPPPPPSAASATKPKATHPNFLEPTAAANAPIPVQKGTKVFVNIAWDANVPPPPEGNEDAIQRAMQGEDDQLNPDAWYVPVIVSNARQDKDKAGSPSIVFDCIYNSSVKARTIRDPDFKIFLIELALQRIEVQYGLSLSRSIGTPNIASKGQLVARTVHIPAALLATTTTTKKEKEKATSTENAVRITTGSSIHSAAPTSTPLIQEISTKSSSGKSSEVSLPGLRGILTTSKKTSASIPPASASAHARAQPRIPNTVTTSPLEWLWTKQEDSGKLLIQVKVPNLTTPLVHASTLDIEPRRIILSIPPFPILDIDASISDAEIAARMSRVYASSPESQNERQEATTRTLLLKRQKAFDVDGADARWKIGTGVVEIFV
ncbi:pre-RNA processing PIH1/Nop17-domain-containing protein [Crepidotus variabilis]|uniref:Pre-RNA processing PIH1/Nop17-domain-containing protein n=1 Tax=Crepidotus variabilis TaxID=179855 RepID=A0A9P6EBI8_9AGAR|nr:pre-RNA processing PIH1/Nop17-domain-containing protein [Crepidotus variabilis]